MENEPKFLNTNKEIENESLVNQDVLVRKLNELLKGKKLSATTIEQESKNLGITFAKLGYLIFFESGLSDEFYNYVKELEGNKFYSNEEIGDLIASFLEKVQQKLEPVKVEQESQVVDVSVTSVAPVAPVIIPEEKPQPAIITPQKVEVQIAPEPPKKVEIPIAEPTPVIKKVESIPKPERKNWWEVKRETEVMAIEDLDGSMDVFERHVKALGVAKKDASGEWGWTGGNKKLVFLGDILGDRGMDGIEIVSIIGDLAKQAEGKDGQIDFLCGNHDMFFLNFLSKTSGSASNQYLGVWELAQFDPDSNSELKKIEPLIKSGTGKSFITEEFMKQGDKIWADLYNKMPEILANMRKTKEGRDILGNICQMKVVVVHDDTLFCHTDPTTAIVADLTKGGNIFQRVAEVNEIFQENIRSALLEGTKFSDEFKQIEKIYLNTRNRAYFVDIDPDLTQDLYSRFREGINRLEIEEKIEEWKADNRLLGNYADEIMEILDEYKSKNKEPWRKYELHSKLMEKIKKSNSAEENIEKVRNSGINAIIHGHSPTSGRNYDKNDLIIVSPHSDFSDFNIKASGVSVVSGISTIQKNGKIDLVGKSFREQNVKIAKKVPNQTDQKREKQKNMAESVRKLAELFTKFELSYDFIKDEAKKINVTPAELAAQFIQSNDRLRVNFDIRLNSTYPVASERTYSQGAIRTLTFLTFTAHGLFFCFSDARTVFLLASHISNIP